MSTLLTNDMIRQARYVLDFDPAFQRLLDINTRLLRRHARPALDFGLPPILSGVARHSDDSNQPIMSANGSEVENVSDISQSTMENPNGDSEWTPDPRHTQSGNDGDESDKNLAGPADTTESGAAHKGKPAQISASGDVCNASSDQSTEDSDQISCGTGSTKTQPASARSNDKPSAMEVEATSAARSEPEQIHMEDTDHVVSKSFVDRLNELPLCNVTVNQLISLYHGFKGKHPLIERALETGEVCMKTVANTALPVVQAAATKACTIAKPIVGDDPLKKVDGFASETLAKVEEKFPVITLPPCEILTCTKNAVGGLAQSCADTIRGSRLVDVMSTGVNSALARTELVVEILLPTDSNDAEDLAELDQLSQKESVGAIDRATYLKDRIRRRGAKTLMHLKPVQASAEVVHYIQDKVQKINTEVSDRAVQVAHLGREAVDHVREGAVEVAAVAGARAGSFVQQVHQAALIIPSKTVQLSGQVMVTGEKVVFFFLESTLPLTVVDQVKNQTDRLKQTVPELTSTATAYVMVPTNLAIDYVLSTRVAEWVLPTSLDATTIQLVSVDDGTQQEEQQQQEQQ